MQFSRALPLILVAFSLRVHAAQSAGGVFGGGGTLEQAGTSYGEPLQPSNDNGGIFGYVVASLPDVDGDGYDEILASAPSDKTFTAGSVLMISGNDGHLITEYHGVNAGEQFGASLTVIGDMNGDGRLDFAVGNSHRLGPSAVVRLFSPTSTVPLLTIRAEPSDLDFGSPIALDDVNSDCAVDVAIGFSNRDGRVGARVYSGKDGTLLFECVPKGRDIAQAWSAMGDIDGDHVRDLAISVGAPGSRAALETGVLQSVGPSSIELYSGKNGALIKTLDGASIDSNPFFGFALSSIADLDQDGIDDLLVGSPKSATSQWPRGRVYVLSSRTLHVVRAIELRNPPAIQKARRDQWDVEIGFARVVAAAGDINGDRIADIVTSTEDLGMSGEVLVFSGKDGSLLTRLGDEDFNVGHRGQSVHAGGRMRIGLAADAKAEITESSLHGLVIVGAAAGAACTPGSVSVYARDGSARFFTTLARLRRPK